MVELKESQADGLPRTSASYESSENQNTKNFGRKPEEDRYPAAARSFLEYQEKPEERAMVCEEKYAYSEGKEYAYAPPNGFLRAPYAKDREETPTNPQSRVPAQNSEYPRQVIGRKFRSNSAPGLPLHALEGAASITNQLPLRRQEGAGSLPPLAGSPPAPQTDAARIGMQKPMHLFTPEEVADAYDSDDGSGAKLSKGRKKIKMEFIKDKGRRGVTFSKRKKGIMKKAYELNVLTKCEILLVVASETGHVYTFATPKLQPIIKQHENLIQQYLNTPSISDLHKMYENPERFSAETAAYYKETDAYVYDGILRGHGYPPGYYHNGYDPENSPSGGPRM